MFCLANRKIFIGINVQRKKKKKEKKNENVSEMRVEHLVNDSRILVSRRGATEEIFELNVPQVV